MTRYYYVSPDDLPIDGRTYSTPEAATKALRRWVQRFAAQGFYAAVGERIPLAALQSRCALKTYETVRKDDGRYDRRWKIY